MIETGNLPLFLSVTILYTHTTKKHHEKHPLKIRIFLLLRNHFMYSHAPEALLRC